MKGIRRYGVLPLLACIALLLAEILQILSFAAPFWAWDSSASFGLWRRLSCLRGSHDGCIQFNYPWHLRGLDGGSVWRSCNANIKNEVFCAPFHWLNNVRGLESVAIICAAIPLVVMPVYVYVSMGLYHRCFLITMAVFTLVAALCNIVGVIVYGVAIGARLEWTVGWCLFVCVIGGVLDIVGFIILLIATFVKPKIPPQTFQRATSLYVNRDTNKLYAMEGDESGRIDIDVSEYGGRTNMGYTDHGNAPTHGGHTNMGYTVHGNAPTHGGHTNMGYTVYGNAPTHGGHTNMEYVYRGNVSENGDLSIPGDA
ncbi:uncharacterized protein LOC124116822 isoform X2 [Haliotis rufescens]|uniref:uncharacterized protein LOC124116822 isoform X2 n=1 Tax=Haliotis rufescens TaxID=6454 RepID=UPI00201EBC42|nr:uncharacterized protein LOC124116822 isoform X2 [Haliotis rufescens]